MSQLKIDDLFKVIEKTRISDDNKNNLPSAKVNLEEATVSLDHEGRKITQSGLDRSDEWDDCRAPETQEAS